MKCKTQATIDSHLTRQTASCSACHAFQEHPVDFLPTDLECLQDESD